MLFVRVLPSLQGIEEFIVVQGCQGKVVLTAVVTDALDGVGN